MITIKMYDILYSAKIATTASSSRSSSSGSGSGSDSICCCCVLGFVHESCDYAFSLRMPFSPPHNLKA